MKILATVHVFYPEFWPELAACLRNVGKPCDIVATIPHGSTADLMVKGDFPDARILKCENRGFDIWPFFKALDASEIDRYTHVLKLHTKRNVHRDPPMVFNAFNYEGTRWRDALLSFVANGASFAKCLSLFAKDPSVSMIAGRDVILRRRDIQSQAVQRTFDEALDCAKKEFGLSPAKPEFVAGTMFIARAEVFKPFIGRFSAEDFRASAKDDTVVTRAHLLERVLGFAACAQGRIADPDDSMRMRHLKSDLETLTAPLRRFLYQAKTTQSGARIIKVCRVPVWHTKGKST